jgi:hypothetical protein
MNAEKPRQGSGCCSTIILCLHRVGTRARAGAFLVPRPQAGGARSRLGIRSALGLMPQPGQWAQPAVRDLRLVLR